MLAHRRGGRAEQEAHVAPIHRQMLELEDRTGREQAVQILGIEPDGRQRHASLHPPLELQQLDLQVRRGGKIRLFLLQPPELGDLTRLGALDWCAGLAHNRVILAELDRTR